MTLSGAEHRTSIEATFAFVDLAGYTAASWVHGDDTAAELAINLLDMAIASCDRHDQVVKSIGDAVMCRSSDPSAALDLVRRLWIRADAEPRFPQMRAALHHGRVTVYREDFFGTTVNIAARLVALADADEILATQAVALSAAEEWTVEPIGERHLRNIGDPVDVLRLSLDDRAPNPVDPICHMRVDPADAFILEFTGLPVYFCSTRCRDTFAAQQGA